MQIIFSLLNLLNWLGGFLPQLGLRALLAYESWNAGYTKLMSENGFVSIQSQFPYPFNQLSAEISWVLVTWTELIGALALALGFATRLFSFSLLLILVLMIMVLHLPAPHTWSNVLELWQLGYHDQPMRNGNIGFQMPLLYCLMLLPLFLQGAGKLSVDYWILRWAQKRYSGF